MGRTITREVMAKAKVIGIVHLERLLVREVLITVVETTTTGVRGAVTETSGVAITMKIMVITTLEMSLCY